MKHDMYINDNKDKNIYISAWWNNSSAHPHTPPGIVP
jgi:hypothetical protein